MAELDDLAARTTPAAGRDPHCLHGDRSGSRAWSRSVRDAGLSVREDPIGNIFARWVGRRPNLPAVGTGSHIDAIPHSGRFDGTVGVLGALEAIRALRPAGFRPSRPIELLMFTSEEPTRFGIGCLGSRAFAGPAAESLAALRDSRDAFDAVRRTAGFRGELSESDSRWILRRVRRAAY